MKENTKIFLLIVFITVTLSFFSFSSAETEINVQDNEINVETIPDNPQPYQDVTINLTSYATDLNKAIITWQGVRSDQNLTGIGKTSYTFKAGGPNTTNTFDITITPVGSNNTISKRITISPSEIDILWESIDGYTPPFYKGKALPTLGSSIKVVAVPNTNTIKNGNGSISYTWKNNDDVVQEVSGYNKNSYTFKSSMFDNINKITVLASSVEGNYGAENTINIKNYKPKILFYKKSPTEGVLYNNILDENSLFPEKEISVVAEPYFLALNGKESSFSYSWNINGNIADTPKEKNTITIHPESRGGFAIIGLTIENAKELFQKITGQLKITL